MSSIMNRITINNYLYDTNTTALPSTLLIVTVAVTGTKSTEGFSLQAIIDSLVSSGPTSICCPSLMHAVCSVHMNLLHLAKSSICVYILRNVIYTSLLMS